MTNALDVLVLLALFVVVMLAGAICSPRGFIEWVREEWRLARADTWEDEPRPCTVTDPDVNRMVARQRAFGERLRDQGRSLLSTKGRPGKQYIPVLTKPAEGPPPRADKVVPIHRPIPIQTRKESL